MDLEISSIRYGTADNRSIAGDRTKLYNRFKRQLQEIGNPDTPHILVLAAEHKQEHPSSYTQVVQTIRPNANIVTISPDGLEHFPAIEEASLPPSTAEPRNLITLLAYPNDIETTLQDWGITPHSVDIVEDSDLIGVNPLTKLHRLLTARLPDIQKAYETAYRQQGILHARPPATVSDVLSIVQRHHQQLCAYVRKVSTLTTALR